MKRYLKKEDFKFDFFSDLVAEASEEQMETDDIDGNSNHATDKDDAEEAAPASEEIDGSSEQPTPTEKDDVSVFSNSFKRFYKTIFSLRSNPQHQKVSSIPF